MCASCTSTTNCPPTRSELNQLDDLAYRVRARVHDFHNQRSSWMRNMASESREFLAFNTYVTPVPTSEVQDVVMNRANELLSRLMRVGVLTTQDWGLWERTE